MTPAPYLSIAAHYDACLARYGDTARGADWPNEEDRARRFDVMLDVGAASGEAATVCDLGCGTGEFYRHIRARGLSRIDYRGIDISPVAIDYARRKFPACRSSPQTCWNSTSRSSNTSSPATTS